MQTTLNITSEDDLPDDPVILKARILRQYILLGFQHFELEELREDIRRLKRQNRTLRALLTPTN